MKKIALVMTMLSVVPYVVGSQRKPKQYTPRDLCDVKMEECNSQLVPVKSNCTKDVTKCTQILPKIARSVFSSRDTRNGIVLPDANLKDLMLFTNCTNTYYDMMEKVPGAEAHLVSFLSNSCSSEDRTKLISYATGLSNDFAQALRRASQQAAFPSSQTTQAPNIPKQKIEVTSPRSAEKSAFASFLSACWQCDVKTILAQHKKFVGAAGAIIVAIAFFVHNKLA